MHMYVITHMPTFVCELFAAVLCEVPGRNFSFNLKNAARKCHKTVH